MLRKINMVLFLCTVLSINAFAVDWSSFPDSLAPKDILVNLNGGFGTANGLILSVDYALPVYSLTVGIEIGFLSCGMQYDDHFWAFAVPILARVSYHPNLGVPKLDVYPLVKIGYSAPGGAGYSFEDVGGGFTFNASVGARYFFRSKTAVFAELGYEVISLEYLVYSDEGSGGLKKYNFSPGTFFNIGFTFIIR
jgi:hypothetical protein